MKRMHLAAILFWVAVPTVLCLGSSAARPSTVSLPGYRNGTRAERHVGVCIDTAGLALVLYSSPSEKQMVETQCDTIDARGYTDRTITRYYVLNKSRAPLPSVVLAHMLKRTSRKNPDAIYCIDRDRQLPRAWHFDGSKACALLLDTTGTILLNAELPLDTPDRQRLHSILEPDP